MINADILTDYFSTKIIIITYLTPVLIRDKNKNLPQMHTD